MIRTAFTVMLLLVAGGVHAADDEAQWRIGASLSFSDYTGDLSLNGSPVEAKDSSTGFKVHGQYVFNSWLGVEGAFYSSPEFKDDIDPGAGGGETETTYQAITLSAIGYVPIPIERLDFFVKAGYANFFDVNVKVDGVSSDSGSDDGITLGGGVSIDAVENLGLRIEYDWYDVSGADLWTIGIGGEYRF